jgi:hypothetical protein
MMSRDLRTVIPRILVLPLALASFALLARANPIVDRDQRGCSALVAELERGPDEGIERRFVRCLGLYGFAPFDSLSRQRLSRFLPRREMLIVAAQRFPYVPDEGLIEWYLPQASAAGRDSLANAMLSWLSPGAADAVENSRSSWGTDLGLGHVLAALTLSDLGDTRAVPALERLLEPAESEELEASYGPPTLYRARLESALTHLISIRAGARAGHGSPGWQFIRERGAPIFAEAFRDEGTYWPYGPTLGEVALRDVGAAFDAAMADSSNQVTDAPEGVAFPPFGIGLRYHYGLAVQFRRLGRDSLVWDDNLRPRRSANSLFDGGFLQSNKLLPRRMHLLIDARLYDAVERALGMDALDDVHRREFENRRGDQRFFAVEKGADASLEREFIIDVGRRGFFSLDSTEQSRMSARFDRFGPLVLRAQRLPFLPDRPLIDWFLTRADRAQRRAMLDQLLEWLTPPESLVASRSNRWPERRQRHLGRLLAADALTDLGDTRALPRIRSLLTTTDLIEDDELHEAQWLRGCVARFADPAGAGFLATDGRGGVRLRRALASIKRIGVSWNPERGIESTDTLDASAIQRLWPLLETSRSRGVHAAEHGRTALVIEFDDGLRAALYMDARGKTCCADNGRIGDLDFRWGGLEGGKRREAGLSGVELENPALAAEVRRLLPKESPGR